MLKYRRDEGWGGNGEGREGERVMKREATNVLSSNS
jgi:hypothetical protein